MKTTLEAWQLGYETGYDDGMYGEGNRLGTVTFPRNYKHPERVSFSNGYNEGYKDVLKHGFNE